MVRECAVPECGTHARFNIPGESHGVYCSKHKVDGMRNVVHKPCAEPGCVTLAVFNQPGAGHGLYCGQHKPIGYVNVKDRKCQGPGCARMPNFNFPGEKGGIFCAQHKAEGMVDIKHKRCVEPGCSKRPSFNFTGEMRALYCGPHKLEGMVNVDQERRTCNRSRFAEDGSPEEAKRQRTQGPGYAAKNAGYPLRLSGAQTDQQGLPLDPQQMQGQAYALVREPQAAMNLAANFGGGVNGVDGSVLVDPQAAGMGSAPPEEGQAVGYIQGHASGEPGDAGMEGHAQAAMQYYSHDSMQGHPGHDPSNIANSQPLGFLLLPQTQWRGEGQPVGSSQQAPQQQLIVDPSKQSQPYMSGAAEVVPQLLSPAELKLQSSQLTAEQLQGADESTRRAAEQRSLGHAMHAHLVEFLRSLLRTPGMEELKDAKLKVKDYIDRFTTWDPDTRVEQYSLLQFEWELAGDMDKWAAVEERMGKVLSLV